MQMIGKLSIYIQTMYVCMYVHTYVRMYVCTHVCKTKMSYNADGWFSGQISGHFPHSTNLHLCKQKLSNNKEGAKKQT